MNRKYKWLFFTLAFILLAVSGATVRNAALADRAIVTGLGIDLVDGQVEVSAQILVARSEEDKESATSVVSARAPTVGGALDGVSKKTGMPVLLSHCDLVVLGKEVIEYDAYIFMDHLMRNAYISENALLAAAEGSAREILECQVIFSDAASFYARRAIVAFGSYSEIAKRTVKDFIVSHNDVTSANHLAVISKEPASGKGTGAEGEEKEEYIFDLSKTAVFKEGVYLYTSTADETAGINFNTSETDKGAIRGMGDNGEIIDATVTGKRRRVSCNLDTMTVTLEITLLCEVREILAIKGGSGAARTVLSQKEMLSLSQGVADGIYAAYYHAKDYNVDIFDFYGQFYRKYGKKWSTAVTEDYLSQVDFRVQITLKMK